MNHWKSSIANINSNPVFCTCTYKLFKTDFKLETDLDVVKDNQHIVKIAN